MLLFLCVCVCLSHTVSFLWWKNMNDCKNSTIQFENKMVSISHGTFCGLHYSIPKILCFFFIQCLQWEKRQRECENNACLWIVKWLQRFFMCIWNVALTHFGCKASHAFGQLISLPLEKWFFRVLFSYTPFFRLRSHFSSHDITTNNNGWVAF